MASTFSKIDIDSAWVELVNGANYSRFGVQVQDRPISGIRICIAGSVPAADTENYLVIGGNRTSKEFSQDLLSTDKVYVRTNGGQTTGVVRGVRVPR